MNKLTIVTLLALNLISSSVVGAISKETVFEADKHKADFYVPNGTIIGGDQRVNDVIVLDIRFAQNDGFERIVLDIDGSVKGDVQTLKIAPYFHLGVSQTSGQLMFTVWGKPKLAFNSKKIKKLFQKSELIEKVDLLPVLDSDRWSFVIHLKEPKPVEVFQLSDPVRIIMDVREKSTLKVLQTEEKSLDSEQVRSGSGV